MFHETTCCHCLPCNGLLTFSSKFGYRVSIIMTRYIFKITWRVILLILNRFLYVWYSSKVKSSAFSLANFSPLGIASKRNKLKETIGVFIRVPSPIEGPIGLV